MTTRTAVALPPKPERQQLESPETLKDYARIIIYYEYLVQEWESWGAAVTEIVEDGKK